MAIILDGKALAKKCKETVKKEAESLKRTPGLAVIIVGNNPASRVYVNSKRKDCEECGFLSEEYALPEETTEAELIALIQELKEKEPETIEIARKSLSYAQKLVTAIEKCEKELSKLRRDADARDKQQHEVRVRAAKVRAEFDALKKVYDGEYHEQAVQLQKLRAEAAKAAEGIEPKLLAKYKEIKQHTVPPIARLVDGNRCGGCNMNMPQVIMGQIKQGAKSVECENCGRIVIVD